MGVITKKQTIIGTFLGIILFVCVFLLFNMNNKQNDSYYQVIFDSMGGSEVAGQNVVVGEQVKQPSVTIREGYLFKGWYLDDKKYDFSTKVKQDLTLRAKWEKVKEQVDEEISDAKEENKEEEKEEENKEVEKEEIVQTPNEEKKPSIDKKDEETNNENIQQPTQSTTIAVASIALNKSNLSLKVGESDTLVVNIQPTNATNKNVAWSSSNNGVATITNGNVMAVGSGTATITATVDGKSTSCVVTVTKNITYSYEMVDIPSSAIGQCYIYIKSSEGIRVNGTININYINGESETVQVTSSGVMKVKSTISSISIINAG